jgi:hypothetical protein
VDDSILMGCLEFLDWEYLVAPYSELPLLVEFRRSELISGIISGLEILGVGQILGIGQSVVTDLCIKEGSFVYLVLE